jgi:hypothetical protein
VLRQQSLHVHSGAHFVCVVFAVNTSTPVRSVPYCSHNVWTFTLVKCWCIFKFSGGTRWPWNLRSADVQWAPAHDTSSKCFLSSVTAFSEQLNEDMAPHVGSAMRASAAAVCERATSQGRALLARSHDLNPCGVYLWGTRQDKLCMWVLLILHEIRKKILGRKFLLLQHSNLARWQTRAEQALSKQTGRGTRFEAFTATKHY